ncbi:azurin [Pseudoxanthomonas sp. SGD-10]|nr:azurin [Pseudoxanthomonas sp. SGD-10]
MRKIHLCALAMLASVTLWSCGGSGNQQAEQTETTSSTATVSSNVPLSQEIVLEGNDQMKFNIEEFRVKAGEQVTLTLKHTGTMAKDVMGHNVVILTPGTDLATFATDAIKAKATDYIPEGYENAIVAHTALIGGGESDTITFTFSEAGTYEFLCSFPGHSSIMKGIIVAE